MKSESIDQWKATYVYWRIAGAVLVVAGLGWFLLVANLMFLTQGVLFLVAAVLVVRTASASLARRVFLLCAASYAIGYAMIGAFPGSARAAADGTFALHVLGATLAIVCGYLAMIVAGLYAHRRVAPRGRYGPASTIGGVPYFKDHRNAD